MSSDQRRSPELPGRAPGARNGWFDDSRTERGPSVVESVGNRPARLKRTAARASRSRASAIFRSWLAVATSSSSARRSASANRSHQAPRGRWSLGSATFHPSFSL